MFERIGNLSYQRYFTHLYISRVQFLAASVNSLTINITPVLIVTYAVLISVIYAAALYNQRKWMTQFQWVFFKFTVTLATVNLYLPLNSRFNFHHFRNT